MPAQTLRTTIRTVRRDSVYALINVIGLAVGLACFITIALYLEFQFSYDRHFENHQNIYRLSVERNNRGAVNFFARTSNLVPPNLQQNYAEVVDFVRFRPGSSSGAIVFRNGETTAYWDDVYLADDNIFQVFNHNIVYGDPQSGLVEPTTVAISESLSRYYFGDRNPVGETLETDTAAYTVTVVYEDLPDNTHHKHNAILSFNRLLAFGNTTDINQGSWNIQDFVYLVMEEGYQPERFADISQAFYDEYMAESGAEFQMTNRFYLEPLAGIHFDSITINDLPRGNRFYLYTFAAIGVLVLVIALINYINLATVRSIRRSKEIGMRKVLGAGRWQLIAQFLSESVSYTFVAVILACLFVGGLLTFTGIEILLNSDLEFDLLGRPELIILLAGLTLLVGFISGLYPAFYLSSIQPAAAFRDYRSVGRSALVRQSLVFLQFVISIAVISCTLIMSLQLRYLQQRDLGFDKDRLILVTVRGADMIERLPTIIADLSQDSRVEFAAQTGTFFGQDFTPFTALLETEEGPTQQFDINSINVGEGWVDTLGIEILQGRDLDAGIDDPHAALVTRSLVNQMGWANPLGKVISYPNDPEHVDTVIGVIENFHFQALHVGSEPLVVFLNFSDFSGMPALNRAIQNSALLIRLADPGDPTNLAYLQDRWNEFDPNHPFEYQFVNDIMANLYLPERSQILLIGLFAGVCVFISCLGLFGLSAFNTTRRAKELSIRKVLGASPLRMIVMLFRNSVGLIVAASFAATVLSILILTRWLSNFEYRETLAGQWEVFIFSALIALLIAFCTVALQALKTVQTNPADKLRLDN